MIQRYTCIPTSEYDVLIVTNGTINQVESKLIEINEKTNNEIPLHSNFSYVETFNDLLKTLKQHYVRNTKLASSDDNPVSDNEAKFNGKVLFMFFNGVEFVQSILSDLIDHYHSVIANYYSDCKSHLKSKKPYEVITNAYFYFDSTISMTPTTLPSAILNDAYLFNTMLTIANDILKKISFMVVRIRGIFIDDIQLAGEKVYPLHCLMRNFPNVERIELTSFSSILMNDMIVL